MPPGPARCLAAVVALTLLGSGCSSDGDDEPAPPPPSSSSAAPELPLPVVREPTSARLAVRPGAVWRSPDSEDGEIALLDDLAVFTGTVGYDDTAIAVDLATGGELWRISLADVVPGTSSVKPQGTFASHADPVVTAPTDEGPVVLLPYRDEGCEYGCSSGRGRQPLGVVALDARTGEAVWGRGLVEADADLPGRLRFDSDAIHVTAASREVVVAEVGSRLVVDRPFDDADERDLPAGAVGLDPATGRQLWVREGVHPLDVVGDVVLAIEHRARTPLLGLDTRTGEVRWRGREVLDHDLAVGGVLLDSVTPGLVAVSVDVGRPRLIDPATGRDLPEQLPDEARFCAPTRGGPVVLACSWLNPATLDSHLLTVDESGRQVLSATTSDGTPDVATGGLVGMETSGYPATVVDASGRRAGRVGGRLVVLQDPWVVVGRGDDDRERLVVLRRR